MVNARSQPPSAEHVYTLVLRCFAFMYILLTCPTCVRRYVRTQKPGQATSATTTVGPDDETNPKGSQQKINFEVPNGLVEKPKGASTEK